MKGYLSKREISCYFLLIKAMILCRSSKHSKIDDSILLDIRPFIFQTIGTMVRPPALPSFHLQKLNLSQIGRVDIECSVRISFTLAYA